MAIQHPLEIDGLFDVLYSGWWFQPLRKMMEFVSWDDFSIPN